MATQLNELVENPREGLPAEYKSWLDLSDGAVRADFAVELLALANHGGGHLVFGFAETPAGLTWSGECPYDVVHYSQDAVNGAVARFADPPFHCEVHWVTASSGNEHVIVVVPGGHKIPVRSKRDGPPGSRMRQNVYYIRRPLPESAPIGSAQEWTDLIARCIRAQTEDLLDSFRRIVNALGPGHGLESVVGAVGPSGDVGLREWEQRGRDRLDELVEDHLSDESPSRYARGTWSVAYELPKPQQPTSLSALYEILREVAGHETGWPPWWVPTREGIRPYTYKGLIECWLATSTMGGAAHSDLWRADVDGRMFLIRGYQEDSTDRLAPGAMFDLTLPVWRVGECLLHARRFARRLTGDDATIRFMVRWRGLEGRELAAVASPLRDVIPGRVSRENEITSEVATSGTEIEDALPEVVRRLVEPLYGAFDFFLPPANLYAEEIARMRSRQ